MQDIKKFFVIFSIIILSIISQSVIAAGLIQVEHSAQANDNVVVKFKFDGSVLPPKSFITQAPRPSIIIDFPNVNNNLKNAQQTVDEGLVNKLTVVEAEGRTRAIVDLKQPLTEKNYQLKRAENGTTILLTVNGVLPKTQTKGLIYGGRKPAVVQRYQIKGIDFRRTENAAGKIIIKLSSPDVNVNVQEKGTVIESEFLKTSVPDRLQRRLDVTDFNTPVKDIQLRQVGMDTMITINSRGLYQQVAYQLNDTFIIEVRGLSEAEQKELQKRNKTYNGERISLNFQDIKVRAVLQLIAEFTGLNVVTSDSVNGSITLRLKDVPWDQALDIILKTQGLGERRMGNIILIAPAAELTAREKAELEADQQVAELSPLYSELIQINYANAESISNLLKGESTSGSSGASILSERGTVSVDERTNTLWVQDTMAKLNEVREFIHKLDIPVKQVMLKARIVNVNTQYQKDLGVRFGVTRRPITGTLEASNSLQGQGENFTEVQAVPVAQRLNVSLPAPGVGSPGGAAGIGIALANLGGGTLLDMELSALESEGGGEIISSPTLLTSNQQQAVIEQGVEIPYQQATSSGATVVAFKKAVLSLQVTPQITPDNRVILTLQVNQDTPGEIFLGVPSINTRQVQTQVLVNNGETVALGGFYEQTKQTQVERVPFFGSLPVVGRLFRHSNEQNDRTELIIFITPSIVQQKFTNTP